MSSDLTSRPDCSSRGAVSSLRLSLTPIDVSYFGDDVYDSPDDGSDDTLSDATFDDADRLSFGYPLERMPRQTSGSQLYRQITALLKVSPCSSSMSSRSGSFASLLSPTGYDPVDYDEVIEEMLHQSPSPFLLRDSRNMVGFTPSPHSKFSPIAEIGPRLMIKALSRSSPELLLLLELNHPDSRGDPWNPVPHIMSAVERVDQVYLFMHGLSEYSQPPLQDVAQYIDFFRQILEGLTFLHEQGVSGLNCSEISSFMVDLSASRIALSPRADCTSSFDRSAYPVRYYFVNYSAASRSPAESISSASTVKSEPARDSPFQKDIRECGALLERLVLDVPQISAKFKSLTRGMIHGNFTADNSRRLFEALCHSLDPTIFESRVSPRPPRMLERAHTVSHSRPLSSKFLQLEKASSH